MNGQDYEQLTLFPADSPASHSLLPESEEARKMTATSGRKWLGLSKNSGPLGLLEKTLLESLRWHSPIFYLSWKPVDIGQGHFLYQLALSEPDTDVTAWQSWPTPDTMCYRDGNTKRRAAKGRHAMSLNHVVAAEEPKIWKTPIASDAANREMYVNSQGEPNLSGQVKLWPTPKASDCKGTGKIGSASAEHDMKKKNLRGVVMYATPQARDYRTGQASRWENPNRSRNLNDQVAIYPTPTTDSANGRTKKYKQGGAPLTAAVQENGNGQLNPDWVEWLQGFPIGWTEV